MSTSPHSLPYNNDRLLLFGEGEGFSFFGFISLLIFGDWLGIPVATGIADGCTILQLVGHGSQARWGVWPIAPLDVVRLRALGYRYWFSCLAGKLCYERGGTVKLRNGGLRVWYIIVLLGNAYPFFFFLAG